MTLTWISILISILYILISLIPGARPSVDLIFTPIVLWSVGLTLLSVFINNLSITVPLFFVSIPFLIGISTQWIGFVSRQTGNKKMKKDYDEFAKKINPMNIIKDIGGPVYVAFEYTIDKVNKAWFSLTDILKMLWNQVITILELVVTLGGAVDEDLAPPLPGKFLTAQLIKDGRFWKYKGEEPIYWSEDKDKLSKNKRFKNISEYNKFRESYGLKKDESLKDVKIKKTFASLIKYPF
jgi:hypothetical protein